MKSVLILLIYEIIINKVQSHWLYIYFFSTHDCRFTDRWADRGIDGQIDGQTDGWMDRQILSI